MVRRQVEHQQALLEHIRAELLCQQRELLDDLLSNAPLRIADQRCHDRKDGCSDDVGT
jgi:hypothetical protein